MPEDSPSRPARSVMATTRTSTAFCLPPTIRVKSVATSPTWTCSRVASCMESATVRGSSRRSSAPSFTLKRRREPPSFEASRLTT